MSRGASNVQPSQSSRPVDTTIEDAVVTFGGDETPMIGILSRPAGSQQASSTGVVIVVGGPQTRVGSHRQFVMLARALARAGHACLRFDASGMGDSSGPKPDFEKLGPDIRAASDALLAQVPECSRIVLWGLCDGATASLLHARDDARVAGVVAANPWARDEATRSAAIVRDHYGSRLRSPEFWRRLLSGKVQVWASVLEAIRHVAASGAARSAKGTDAVDEAARLPLRVARAVSDMPVPLRLQLSGTDLTASEFRIAMEASGIDLQRANVAHFDDADHTFSRPSAWSAATSDTLAFVAALDEAGARDRAMSDQPRGGALQPNGL